MNVMVELNMITGFMLGFEWLPVGSVDDEVGFVVFDIGIVRFLITYQ